MTFDVSYRCSGNVGVDVDGDSSNRIPTPLISAIFSLAQDQKANVAIDTCNLPAN
jgi:hypothetical protein